MAQIHVSGLHKTYLDGEGKKLHILKGLNFNISSGSTVAIIGASGTGKSTFLHLLGALEGVEEGSIQIKGTSLNALSREARAEFRNKEIGFIFQFHQLLQDFNAQENVMLPLLIHGWSHEKALARSISLLKKVGLENRLTHKPSQLSGGEQQRVAIARAIVNSPSILLADEPTGNLDRETGNYIMELLLTLNSDEGITIIMITHNPILASRMQHQYRMENGLLHRLPH